MNKDGSASAEDAGRPRVQNADTKAARIEVLTALRDRLAKATGPDRALDESIALTFGWKDRDAGMWWLPPNTPASPRTWVMGVPSFTASIDAAVTLVPDGHSQHINQADDGSWWAEFREGYCTSYRNVYLGHAKTEPLARCLARITHELAAIAEGEA